MSIIRSNPFGGTHGLSFDDSNYVDAWGRITQIVVRHGDRVDSIGVAYDNGHFINHGGTGGSESVINLKPDEFISKINGRSGDVLDQIILYSNRGLYRSFGGQGGTPFTVDFSGKALLYLFGRAGDEIDQIGFGYGDPPPLCRSPKP